MVRVPYLKDNEANDILSETLRPMSDRASLEWAAARRWVPWICAFTGARVIEITQMRGQDVEKYVLDGEDVWVIRITPEAGTVKNRKVREVPCIRRSSNRASPSSSRPAEKAPCSTTRPKNAAERPGTSRATRSAKSSRPGSELNCVSDTEVSPNHGWRHRFNRVARRDRDVPGGPRRHQGSPTEDGGRGLRRRRRVGRDVAGDQADAAVRRPGADRSAEVDACEDEGHAGSCGDPEAVEERAKAIRRPRPPNRRRLSSGLEGG